MRFSIRVRLTLWYTALFAAFVGVVAFGGYGFLARVTLADVDDLLRKSSAGVITSMQFEWEVGETEAGAVRHVVEGLRLPDVMINVLDEDTREARPAAPPPPPRSRKLVPPAVRRALDDSLEMAVRRAPRHENLTTTEVSESQVRILTVPSRLGPRGLIVGVAHVMVARQEMLASARLALGVGLPLVLVLAAAGGWWLAGLSLTPVAAMSARAREIGARNLHERLPVGARSDELSELAHVMNDLIGRVQTAFAAQTRFVAEASHELRTPVAVISGEAELALAREGRSAAELREALTVIHAESQRLRGAIDDLFFLARADAGERQPRMEPVDVREIAVSALRAAQSRAPARTFTIAEGSVPQANVQADGEMIRRVLDNLLDNAIRYSRPDGAIELEVLRLNGTVQIDVRDQGPGVPASSRPHLFERFYRGDDARVLSDTGAGLGLAIARWVARAHGGDLTLLDGTGTGAVFRLTLPNAQF
jgi:two-component system OmpR family sensor kinase